jgi:bifunctional DNA-binding transcriptional regulator/antitoxin component of YhaV-PrlF toxin-antitoxin module
VRYRYTDSEWKILEKNIVIICDTREQNNKHITEFFDKKKIKYRTDLKLDQGDYSCYIERNEETKDLITRDLFFDKDIVIERKGSVRELAGNLQGSERQRLNKEFATMDKYSTRRILLVEDKDIEEYINDNHKLTKQQKEMVLDTINQLKEDDIYLRPVGFDFNVRFGKDMGNYGAKSFFGSFHDFNAVYDLRYRPIEKKFVGSEIQNLLKYHVRYLFKKKGFLDFEEDD